MKIPFLSNKKEKEGESKAIELNKKPEDILAEDIVAPSSIEINQKHLILGQRYTQTFFVFSYPRYLSTGWMSPAINLSYPMDISFHIHPIDSSDILKKLRKKLTEVEAEMNERQEKGYVRDPSLEAAYKDIEKLRDSLQTAREKVFQLGIYLTIYATNKKELGEMETKLRSIFEARMVYLKPAYLREDKGFISTAPYGLDRLVVHTPMDTQPLSSIFPFISPDLSANEGVLYGINVHNNSLVLFDRFTLENANSVVFGKAGSGKSYALKLEVLRYLMQGVRLIVLDPENEYKYLSEAVEGAFLNISLTSPNHLNPFDLRQPREDEDPEAVLRENIINLVGLMRIMLGGLTPEEDAIIDRALTETYAARDITADSDPSTWSEKVPLMSDFQSVLEGMEGTESLVKRVRKYTTGTYAPFFNHHSNVSLDKQMVVFGIRDVEDQLRPIAMYMVLRHIWNQVRSYLTKRILLVDEAWWVMKEEDGASFLYGMCKRGRKYWLGVTTITQDISDFSKSQYGKPIITNSSLQLLLKQSPASIDTVQETFNLTEGEKQSLLKGEVGEGVFIAGEKRVALKVVASYTEDQIITSSPEEVKKIKEEKRKEKEG